MKKLSAYKQVHRMRQSGFSLIELMVTMAIIAILATIALPAYSDYVKEGKAAQATSQLSDLRIKAEQFFQDNLTYVGFPCITPTDPGEAFTYACSGLTATTYTLTATGKNDMSQFVYTLDQDNAKTSNYDGAGSQNCWTTKKGQSC